MQHSFTRRLRKSRKKALKLGSAQIMPVMASPGTGTTISLSDLLPGDILLYRACRQNFVQKRISASTGSPYTHASIYVGASMVAEALAWPHLKGVTLTPVEKSIKGSQCVAVLRTQTFFGPDRASKLRRFVDDVTHLKKLYNLRSILSFTSRSSSFFENQLGHVKANYGKSRTIASLLQANYFCSGFVLACWCAVGIIHNSAHCAYPIDVFSPADLARDDTFGWLLGYLVPPGGSIPSDDPLLTNTQWAAMSSLRWWR